MGALFPGYLDPESGVNTQMTVIRVPAAAMYYIYTRRPGVDSDTFFQMPYEVDDKSGELLSRPTKCSGGLNPLEMRAPSDTKDFVTLRPGEEVLHMSMDDVTGQPSKAPRGFAANRYQAVLNKFFSATDTRN